MSTTPVFCFIDDSDFERNLFREHVAGAFAPVEVICARDCREAEAALGDARPLAFLLDIYGNDPENHIEAGPLAEGLGLGWGDPAALLGQAEGKAFSEGEANSLLRGLHAELAKCQNVFGRVAGLLDQSRRYGLHNLAWVREHHPWALAAAYSRKAAYEDAAAMSLAGAGLILQKPQGEDQDQIEENSRAAAPGLAQEVFLALDRRLAAAAARLALSLCQGEGGVDLAGALGRSAELLEAGSSWGAASERRSLAEKIWELRMDDAAPRGGYYDLLMMLHQWLVR